MEETERQKRIDKLHGIRKLLVSTWSTMRELNLQNNRAASNNQIIDNLDKEIEEVDQELEKLKK